MGMPKNSIGKDLSMSAFLWLDYSERERRKMLDVVDQFRERDTRDELGIGLIRDAFADMLFPGTSTTMTRARYFLLVPWTYQRLEKLRVNSTQIAGRARRAELELVEVIEQSDDSDGNIGKVAKTALKRLPSSVYWQGLGVWGIREFQGAQSQYQRSLDRGYAQTNRHGGRASERDGEHDDLLAPNWHGALIPPPPGFPASCTLRLTRREAEYLADRIRFSPACSRSMLAELVAQRSRSEDVSFVWQHPNLAEVPAGLMGLVDHARNFSELMHGAPLLYNLVLAEQARWDEGAAKYHHAFAEWSESLAERFRVFREWDRERFWHLVRFANPRVSVPTFDFVNMWWDFSLSGDAAQLCDNSAARALIRERER
jgi:hypothetical protein